MTDTSDWALPWSAPAAQYVVAAAPNTLYRSDSIFTAGVYTISCPSTTNTTIEFYDATGALILSTTTISGTITINLPATSVEMFYWTNTGANISVGIQQSGSNIPYTSATLATITASTINTHVGDFYAVLIGGGQGGEGADQFNNKSGAGGDTGFIWAGRVKLLGGETITIGQGTPGSASPAYPGVPSPAPLGSHTTIGAYSSASGSSTPGASPGVYPASAGNSGVLSPAQNALWTFLPNALTTSSGASGAAATPTVNGSSSPAGTIGQGGPGGNATAGGATAGGAGTGFGSGGGSGAFCTTVPDGAQGGHGANGVLYLIG